MLLMKRKNRNQNSQLQKKINSLYSEVDPFEDPIISKFSEYRVDMFQVTKILSSSSIELMHLFNDVEYSPVVADKELISLLHEGAVFLMGLGRNHDHYKIVYMSPPYS